METSFIKHEVVMGFLFDNKEWLFGGVAVSVPIALVGWWLFSGRSEAQTQKSGKNSVNIQVGGNLEIGGKNDDR